MAWQNDFVILPSALIDRKSWHHPAWGNLHKEPNRWEAMAPGARCLKTAPESDCSCPFKPSGAKVPSCCQLSPCKAVHTIGNDLYKPALPTYLPTQPMWDMQGE